MAVTCATACSILTLGWKKTLTTANPGQERARKAGRGGIAVLGAKVFFVVSGFAQQTLLPRAIGLAGYGALALVSVPINILESASADGNVSLLELLTLNTLVARQSPRALFEIGTFDG